MSDQSDINLPPVPPATPDARPTADPLPPDLPTASSAAPSTAAEGSAAASSTPFVPSAKLEFNRDGTPAYQAPDDTPWRHVWRVFSARMQSLSDQAGRRLTQRTLKIGVSARIFHPEAGAKGL
ncbi:MAG TPA: gamma-glutamyl-gamma-aminobutyrate hydrolase, partial [Oxalicibacterium sp.]|nr:gamma-glutamyl-gamma-aminobutyrate hydrolase [Oxalicibacterium sp.]